MAAASSTGSSAAFDYVIIGAGSAGCVLANRLSADPSVRVALIEAGPRDRSPNIKIPPAFPKLFHTKYDWNLSTTSQPELKARELYWPRGRTLGGSSSLNAQMWVRGAKADYDAWGPGWTHDEVLPYFHRAEHRVGSNSENTYGTDGPLYIEELQSPNSLREKFFTASAAHGYARLPELNVPDIDGFAPTPVTQHRGHRWSTADGYLRPALKRPNLTLFVETQTERIVLSGGRATGVQVRTSSGAQHTITASREVILSAGAVHSPALLQLSGIGDAETLSGLGIATHVDLPEVGRNLQDHLSVPMIMFTRDPITLFGADKRMGELLRFVTKRAGQLTSNVGEGVLFARSDPSLAEPDLEIIFAPVPFFDHGRTAPVGHGITLGLVLLQPDSAGSVSLRSNNPFQAPVIDAGYLTAAADLDRLVAGLEICRQIFDQPALAGELAGAMRPSTDEHDLTEYVRAMAETLYHPTGTCRMGSVVDDDLRVQGVDGLRVVDASVIPQIIRGHTHAPTVMIAERTAERLLQG